MADMASLRVRTANLLQRFFSGPMVAMPMLPNKTWNDALLLDTAGAAEDVTIPAGAVSCKIIRFSPATPKVGYAVDGNAAKVPTITAEDGTQSNFDEQFIDLIDEDTNAQVTRLSMVADTDATLLILKFFKKKGA